MEDNYLKSRKLEKLTPRERILGTAGRLFNLKGFRATGVDTLIAESGVAKMTFYKHFPTKQALIMEYLKQRDALIISGLKNLCSSKMPANKKLLGIFDLLKELYDDPNFRGCVFINAVVEARDPKSQEHVFSAEHKKEFRKLIKEVAMEAKVKDSDTVADQLFLLFQGAVVCVQLECSDRPIDLAKKMASIVLQ
jgi:AcrR family transcriptional regulator